MNREFKHQTILVTGATRGIGEAIAVHLLKLGAYVIATGTKNTGERMADVRELENAVWYDADFSDLVSTKAFIKALQSIGPIHGCVNNAGVNVIKPVESVDDDDYAFVHNINLRAPYMICQAVAESMAQTGGGRIVNIASIWSIVSKSQRSLYSSAKTGMIGLTRALAAELGPKGILVNALSPGFVLTDMTRESLSNAEIKSLEAQVPLGRMAEPADIAEVVAFLLSPSNRYLTGQNIIVDGGFTIT